MDGIQVDFATVGVRVVLEEVLERVGALGPEPEFVKSALDGRVVHIPDDGSVVEVDGHERVVV